MIFQDNKSFHNKLEEIMLIKINNKMKGKEKVKKIFFQNLKTCGSEKIMN